MKIGEAMAKSAKLYVLPKKKNKETEMEMETEESNEMEMEDGGTPESHISLAQDALTSGDSEAAIDHLYDAIDAISAGMDTEDVGEYD